MDLHAHFTAFFSAGYMFPCTSALALFQADTIYPPGMPSGLTIPAGKARSAFQFSFRHSYLNDIEAAAALLFFVFWLPSASFRFGLPGLHALSFSGNSIPR